LRKDPFYISASKSIFVDNGIYAFNARQKILTDNFNFEEYNYHLLFPLHTYITLFFLKISGIDYFKLVLCNALLAVIVCLIFSLCVEKKYRLIIFSFFAFSIVLITFSRSAMIENNIMLFFALFLLLFKSENKLPKFLCGLLAALGILVKSNFVIIAVALICYCIYQYLKNKKIEYYYIFGIFCGIAILSLSYLIYYDDYISLKNSVIYRQIIEDHKKFKIYQLFEILFFLKNNLFIRELPLYFLFLAGLYRMILNKDRNDKISALLIFVLFFNVLFVNYSYEYSPLRYRIFMLPVMIFIGLEYFRITNYKESQKLKCALIFLFFYPIVWWLLTKKVNVTISGWAVILVAIVGTFGGLYILKKLRAVNLKIFMVIFLSYAAVQYLNAYKKSGYYLSEIMTDISKEIQPNAKVIGWWAPQIFFNFKNVMIIPGNPYIKYIKKYSPDYILHYEDKIYYANYKLIKEYNIPPIKQKLCLFKAINLENIAVQEK